MAVTSGGRRIEAVEIGAPGLEQSRSALERLGFFVRDGVVGLGAQTLRLIEAPVQGLAGLVLSGGPINSGQWGALLRSGPSGTTAGAVLHPNGARTLISVTIRLDRPADQLDRLGALFGPGAATPTDEMVTVHCGGTLIYLVNEDDFDHLHPYLDLALPPAPGLAALSVEIADPDRAAWLLAANGVAFLAKGDLLAVRAGDSLGFGLELVRRPGNS